MPAAERTPRRLAGWLGGAAAVALLAALFAALPTPPVAEAAGSLDSPPAGSFAVTGARLFDGERTHEAVDVVVADGRIAAVGAGAADALPDDVPRVDGSGRTLLPGLIDAHTHTWGDSLADALRLGVTTVLDQFTDPSFLAERKRRHGPIWFPGPTPMAAADLSAVRAVAFRARSGGGGPFRLMVLTANGGGVPAALPFEPGAGWRRFEIAFADLAAQGLDPTQVTAILWTGGPQLGAFDLDLDDVELLGNETGGGR